MPSCIEGFRPYGRPANRLSDRPWWLVDEYRATAFSRIRRRPVWLSFGGEWKFVTDFVLKPDTQNYEWSYLSKHQEVVQWIYFLRKKRCVSCVSDSMSNFDQDFHFACWLSLQFHAWNFCSQPIVGISGDGGVLLDKLAVKTRYLPGWQISMSDSVACRV